MGLPDPLNPFVLLDDARAEGGTDARLYVAPVEIVEAWRVEEVPGALDRLERAAGRGLHIAGFLGYEAGLALERRLGAIATEGAGDAPLLWFGLFERCERVAAGAVEALLPDPMGGAVGAPMPLIGPDAYRAAFDKVIGLIRAGDIYQANLTFPCAVPLTGDPRAVYAAVRQHARAGYGGIVFTGTHWLLSFSPELFFTLHEGRLTARPMKGTAARGLDAAGDAAAIAALRDDPKQRAENLMIVDLLRNDLSRVAQPGSVAVPELFHVETYPTVHQMTSTVQADIAPGLGAVDVLRAIFPCGSITGAPKLRAMEVIHAVEAGPRGPYTGSIGHIAPDGNAAFNVAIRTIFFKEGDAMGRIGLGSGVVSDSVADAEWAECLEKGRFLTAGSTGE